MIISHVSNDKRKKEPRISKSFIEKGEENEIRGGQFKTQK